MTDSAFCYLLPLALLAGVGHLLAGEHLHEQLLVLGAAVVGSVGDAVCRSNERPAIDRAGGVKRAAAATATGTTISDLAGQGRSAGSRRPVVLGVGRNGHLERCGRCPYVGWRRAWV